MKNRNVTLDILRTIAISTVFLGHAVLSFGPTPMLAPLQFGGTGVDLFFILSGWLIGSQIYKEEQTYGNVNIIKFWLRRWMRTLPAYYVVLSLTILQLSITKDNFLFPWNYFIFIQNYNAPLNFYSISWSLCVEEQFYLIIAPFLAYCLKLPRRNQTLILLVALILPTVFREFSWYSHSIETHVRWDCCLLGILLANLKYSNIKVWDMLSKQALSISIITFLFYLLCFINRWFPETEINDPSPLVLALTFAPWILMADKKKFNLSILIHKLSYYISTRSYAIYLLHSDALAITNRLFNDLTFISHLMVSLLITLCISELLYVVVEKPFMQMRERFNLSRKPDKTTVKSEVLT